MGANSRNRGQSPVIWITDWMNGNGLRYALDAGGRLTRLTDYDDATLDYAYDSGGLVTSMTDYHSHTTTYAYSDTAQLTTLTAPGSKTWTYNYNALGQPTTASIPNGMTTAYSFDNRNRMTKIEHKDGNTVLDGFTYALTTGGNITRTTHQESAYWDYAYDGRDRLTSAARKDDQGQTLASYTYTYDTADNMLSKAEAGTGTTFAYDAANELTSSTTGGTTTNCAFDAWGRMTSKAISGSYSATYAYRYGDKLYSVTSDFPNEGNVTYQYGADGKRRERTSGGTTTKYRWDLGWNVINDENSGGTLTMTYVTSKPLAEVATILADASGSDPANGTWHYYSQDNLGSTRGLRAQDKSSLGQYEYSPYGMMYAESVASIAYKFTGKAWDGTAQLYYFPYRYYSPSAARWLTRDPLGMVDGPNVYAY